MELLYLSPEPYLWLALETTSIVRCRTVEGQGVLQANQTLSGTTSRPTPAAPSGAKVRALMS